jgi:hypothetical protein
LASVATCPDISTPAAAAMSSRSKTDYNRILPSAAPAKLPSPGWLPL